MNEWGVNLHYVKVGLEGTSINTSGIIAYIGVIFLANFELTSESGLYGGV